MLGPLPTTEDIEYMAANLFPSHKLFKLFVHLTVFGPANPDTLSDRIASLPSDFVYLSDAAATNAETVYQEAVKVLRPHGDGQDAFWPPLENSDDDEEEEW